MKGSYQVKCMPARRLSMKHSSGWLFGRKTGINQEQDSLREIIGEMMGYLEKRGLDGKHGNMRHSALKHKYIGTHIQSLEILPQVIWIIERPYFSLKLRRTLSAPQTPD